MLLLAVASSLPSIAFSQAGMVISDEPQQSLAPHIEYYEDGSEILGITDILAANFDVNFIPYNRDILHFGLTSSAYWLRFNLDWSEITNDSLRILEFGPPRIVSDLIRGGIEVYVVDSDRQITNQLILGSGTSPLERKTLNRGFALTITPEFGNQLYLRVTSARPLRLPVTLWQLDEFRAVEMDANGRLNLQYGILLALL